MDFAIEIGEFTIGADCLLDGATGTELIEVEGDRPELEEHLWGLSAILDAPDEVRTVHRRYAEAGCDVLTTDTWGLPSGLLAVNTGLYGLVERAGRIDLAALASIRMAAAHRMARRFGEAAARLDVARVHVEQLRDPVLRAELDTREQAERTLLAVDRGSGLPPDVPGTTAAALINRSVLCMARDEWDEALEHLLRAEEVAQDAGDVGAQAHSTELQGVVLSRRNVAEAVRAWQLASATFAGIGDEHGEARCLQHLGAAAVTDPVAAGQLLRGTAEPVPVREAAREALRCLERAKALRTGQPDTGLVDHYLALARALAE